MGMPPHFATSNRRYGYSFLSPFVSLSINDLSTTLRGLTAEIVGSSASCREDIIIIQHNTIFKYLCNFDTKRILAMCTQVFIQSCCKARSIVEQGAYICVWERLQLQLSASNHDLSLSRTHTIFENNLLLVFSNLIAERKAHHSHPAACLGAWRLRQAQPCESLPLSQHGCHALLMRFLD